MSNKDAFARWFRQATGNEPYPFQVRFARGDWLRNAVPVPSGHRQPSPLVGEGKGEGDTSGAGLLVDVPTGLGKTAMTVLGWLCGDGLIEHLSLEGGASWVNS